MECTSEVLLDFLSDPVAFFNAGRFKYYESTKTINPLKKELEQIRGITLLKVFDNLDVVCVFPQLFQVLPPKGSNTPDRIINLNDIITNTDICDEKHLLLRFFHELTSVSKEKIKIKISDNAETKLSNDTIKEAYECFFSTFTMQSIATKNSIVQPTPQIASPIVNNSTQSEPNIDMSQYVTIDEYAEMHNLNPRTVRSWRASTTWQGSIKIGGRVYVNKNAPPHADGIRTEKHLSQTHDVYYRLIGDTVIEMFIQSERGNERLAFTYDDSGAPCKVQYYESEIDTTPRNYYYVLNLQGDVIRIVDYENVTVANYTYDAWGNILSITDGDGEAIVDSGHIAH